MRLTSDSGIVCVLLYAVDGVWHQEEYQPEVHDLSTMTQHTTTCPTRCGRGVQRILEG